MITATGYRLIISTNAQMDAGKSATHLLSGLTLASTRDDVAAAMSQVLHPRTLLVGVEDQAGTEDADGGGSFFCFDPSQQVGRDAQVWATVRCLKLDPSTPFEHTRNALWHIENHRQTHTIPGSDILKPFLLLIVDGGGDENPRFVQQIMCLTVTFLRRGAEFLVAATAAAGFTPYRLVEFAQGCFSGTLDGVRIDSDTFGKPRLDRDSGKPKNDEEAALEEKKYLCWDPNTLPRSTTHSQHYALAPSQHHTLPRSATHFVAARAAQLAACVHRDAKVLAQLGGTRLSSPRFRPTQAE